MAQKHQKSQYNIRKIANIVPEEEAKSKGQGAKGKNRPGGTGLPQGEDKEVTKGVKKKCTRRRKVRT